MSVVSISEFSSLNFRNDWKLSFQQNVDYVPKFLPSDRIQVEYISYDNTLTPYLSNSRTGQTIELTPEILDENEDYKHCLLSIDNSGISEDTRFDVCLKLGTGQIVAESDYCVCIELPGTVLLEYTNRRNIKDTIFNGVERFAFRIEGAFLPQENTFENESEDFRDQRYVSRVLSSQVYETKTLTIGGGFGVPNWVARKINLIFSVSSVHVDGIPMVRSEGSAVEINIIHNDYPLYIYKIVLEESEDFNDSQLPEYLRSVDKKKSIARKISDDIFRTYDETGGLGGNAKMIRELELIKDLSEYYTLEIDDNISGSTKRASLGTVIELIKTHFKNNLITFEKGVIIGNPDEKHTKINEKGEIQSDTISSHNFTSGPLGSGHRIQDGNAEFNNVVVRGSISAFEYLIQQVKAVGGKLLLSAASMKSGEVEELEDGYKCYFNTDGGTIMNPFVVNDQAFHQVFNGQKQSRYWRLITEVGSDYIVLSKADCEAGSDVPQVNDEILLLGNRTDINRMSAIILSAYDENSPYTAYYNGINSYSLEGKEIMREGNLNGVVDQDFGQLTGFGMFASHVYLKGQFWLMSGKTVEQSINDGVKSGIDGMKVGGANILADTTSEWVDASNASPLYLVYGNYLPLEIGTEITFSGYIKGIDAEADEIFIEYAATDVDNHVHYGHAETTKRGNFEVKLEKTVKLTWEINRISIYPIFRSPNGGELSGSIQIKQFQIEIGNKATTWSAAQEDVVKKQADFRVSLDGLSSKVSAVETDVDSLHTSVSNIDQKADRISLSVADTREELKDYTDSKSEYHNVWKGWIETTGLDENTYYPVTIGVPTQYGRAIIRVESVLGTSGKPSWSTHTNGFSVSCEWSVFGSGWGTQKEDRIINVYEQSFVNGNSLGNIAQMTYSSQEVIYLRGGGKYYFICCNTQKPVLRKTSYTWTSNDGQSTQSAPLLTSVTPPAPTYKAEIKLLKDQIDLSVTSKNIINRINVSTEGVRIDASKIEISGNTIFKKGQETINIFGSGDDVFSINNGQFKVDRYGKAILKNAEVEGKIIANEGEFTGKITVTEGIFKGPISTLSKDGYKITINPNDQTFSFNYNTQRLAYFYFQESSAHLEFTQRNFINTIGPIGSDISYNSKKAHFGASGIINQFIPQGWRDEGAIQALPVGTVIADLNDKGYNFAVLRVKIA